MKTKILIILIILIGLTPISFNFENNGIFAQTVPVLQNDKLLEFIEWAKTYDIKLIGTKRSGQYIENNIWNSATDEIPLTAIDGINSVFEDLQKIPSHLINTLRGNAIFFSSGSDIESSLSLYQRNCVNRAGFFLRQAELSEKYQKVYAELPREAREEGRRTYIPAGILPYMGEDGFYAYPYDMFLCMPGGATIHEFGHIVDLNGIRMFNGRETALGKTDEETHLLYAEYERIFGVNKLSPEIRRQWQNSTSTMPGILNNYGLDGDDENFAVSFDYYVREPQFFRDKAVQDSGVAEKYEFLKTKIFLGKEYDSTLAPISQTTPQSTPNFETKVKQLQEQIANLQAQIVKLQAQLAEIQKMESTFTFTKSLYRGIRDDEVKTLQELLKQYPDIYPEGLMTGYFGPLTEKAVKKFQEKYGIESIGIVGPKTRQKLNEFLSQKVEVTPIEEVRPEKKEAPSLQNDKLPEFIEWAKEHEITLIRTKREILGDTIEKIWNPATDEIPFDTVVGIDQPFESLKKIPPHLIKLLQGQTVFLYDLDDCSMSYVGTGLGSLIKLSQKYQKKPIDLPEEAIQEIAVRIPKGLFDWEGNEVLATGKAYDFYYSGDSGSIVYPKDMYLCIAGNMIHEFGHIVDFNGIQMNKGREFALGKTDEGIRKLYDEYKRVFQVPEEYQQAYWEGTLKEPPSGFITIYATKAETENFADSFAYYIENPQYFRERAAKEPGLAEKYEFLKTKIFLGREY